MIDDLSSYELAHFLPFTREVYARLFTLHNEAWWPLHLVFALLAIGLVGAVLRDKTRASAIVLACSWVAVALLFFVGRYAELLWIAPWFGAMFGAQAALLVAARDRFELIRPRVAAIGIAVVVIGWVLLTPMFGRPWSGVELFGLTPDPTALATLALLSGATRRSWFLWPIPLLWCVVSGLTSYGLLP